MEERFKQQLDFILELDKSKEVTRQTYLASGVRKENDAEHSWHLAVMCMVLSEYANEKIDVLRTMEMVLIHDVIEIDAGDTYAYDLTGNSTKAEREKKAADRIFALLPEDQGRHMRELWDEFERADTPEARFANTLDKVQPLLLNNATGGRSWAEHGVAAEQVYRRNQKTGEGSQVLWEYAKGLIEKNEREGKLK